jgi:hypothetical protein
LTQEGEALKKITQELEESGWIDEEEEDAFAAKMKETASSSAAAGSGGSSAPAGGSSAPVGKTKTQATSSGVGKSKTVASVGGNKQDDKIDEGKAEAKQTKKGAKPDENEGGLSPKKAKWEKPKMIAEDCQFTYVHCLDVLPQGQNIYSTGTDGGGVTKKILAGRKNGTITVFPLPDFELM